jgi:hypothetical protein
MKAMKSAGMGEVRKLRQRVIRLRAMERVSEEDCKYITRRCDEIEARIASMFEDDPSGREF